MGVYIDVDPKGANTVVRDQHGSELLGVTAIDIEIRPNRPVIAKLEVIPEAVTGLEDIMAQVNTQYEEYTEDDYEDDEYSEDDADELQDIRFYDYDRYEDT